jgi:hypothetical protein
LFCYLNIIADWPSQNIQITCSKVAPKCDPVSQDPVPPRAGKTCVRQVLAAVPDSKLAVWLEEGGLDYTASFADIRSWASEEVDFLEE